MSWTHLEDSTPVARKPHRCFLCGLGVEPGERHVKRAGIDDDGPSSFRMHSECEGITRDWDGDDWDGTEPSDFRERLAEAMAWKGGAS